MGAFAVDWVLVSIISAFVFELIKASGGLFEIPGTTALVILALLTILVLTWAAIEITPSQDWASYNLSVIGLSVIGRFLGFIAGAFLALVMFIMGLGEGRGLTGKGAEVAIMFQFVGYWIYWATMESSPVQATLGKWVFGIKVIDLEGKRISFVRATGRYFGRILTMSFLIVLIPYDLLRGKSAKMFHDLLARTQVVAGR